MFKNLDVLRLSQAMAQHAGQRQAVAARNLANADTPGYGARDLIPFRDLVNDGGDKFGLRATRSNHLNGVRSDAPHDSIEVEVGESDPNGNSVSLEAEMMRAVDIRRQHERSLAIYRSSLNILRGSLGR